MKKNSIFTRIIFVLILAFNFNVGTIPTKVYAENLNSSTNVAINFDKASPAKAGDAITVTAASTGVSNALYKFWIHDGHAWYVVQDYSSNSVYKWNGTKAGNYKIWVDVKGKYSTKERDSYKEVQYYVNNDICNATLSTSLSSPQAANKNITITAGAAGTGKKLYRFWIHDGRGWNVVREYGESNTYDWKPINASKYRIWVDVKEQKSSQERDDYKEIYYDINSDINFNSIETNIQSPQNIGNSVKITANCTSGSNMLFRFWIFDGQSWTVVRDYTRENQYIWTPNKSGNCRIWVDVKAVNSLRDVDYSKEINYKIENKPIIETISTNYSSPRKINNNIIVTANAKYGENNLYRFWIHDGINWSIVQNYSQSNTYSWTPTKEGKHRIWVDVKSSRSNVDVESSKEIPFCIEKYGIIDCITYSNNLDNYSIEQITKGNPVYYDNGKWIDASSDQVKYYMNPQNFINDDNSIYQFLKLTYCEGILSEDLNNVLAGKGVLQSKGDVFLAAGKTYNINPIYLVSHSLLETGNGMSQLAKGVTMPDGKVVYNIYGIGAYDDNPIKYGSEFAYKQGWFSVEEAIIGGAKFIGANYINSDSHQDTLYKMRWNVNNVYHQYATDIGWAQKQTYRIRKLIDNMRNSIFYFQVPVYK